jgi:hypothetical protein
MATKELRQIVLEAGTRRKRDLRLLREQGSGPLQSEVDAALQFLKTADAAPDGPSRDIVPVVLLVERRSAKTSRARRRGLLARLLDI